MLKRTLIGAALLATLLGAWWVDSRRPGEPALALALLGAVVQLGALEELLRMTAAPARLRHVGRLAGVAWLAALVAAGLGLGELALRAGDVLAAASVLTGLWLVLRLRGGPSAGVSSVARSLWFAVPWTGGLGCLVALLMGGDLAWVVGLVLVAKSSDIGAYFTGKTLGRHKLIPAVSPGKTWEGLVGGLLLPALVASWLLADATLGGNAALPAVPGGAPGAALAGLVVGVIVVLSDLTESLVKRSLGVKDSGHLFGESGGFLDLADSLLLLAPLALAYTAVAGS